MEDNVLPHNREFEKLVLGSIMTDRNAFGKVEDILTEACFYDPKHREIYLTVKSIAQNGKRADMVSVSDELRKSGSTITPYEVAEIAVTHTFDVEQYAYELKDKAMRRELLHASEYLRTNCFSELEDTSDVIIQATEMLENIMASSSNSIVTIHEGLEEVYKTIDRNLRSDSKVTGLETGFTYFDKRSGGLQKSDLVIIAGETSQGKTSFALSMLNHIAKENHACAIYSLEMNLLQLSSRFASMESKVSSKEIMFSKLSQDQIEKIDKGIIRISESKIYIDENSTSSLDNIVSSIRYLVIKYHVEVVVVDYLQLVEVKGINGNKEQKTAYLARKLKNTAKQLDITIIALSQLSRDSSNPLPRLSRLRDSGQIEEAADVVAFVYRPESYNRCYPEPFDDACTENTAMIDIAKGRNIGVFKFLCGFNSEITHFYHLDARDVPKNIQKKQIPF